MIRLNSTTVVWSLVCARTRPALLLLLLFTLANSIACNRLNASKPSGNTVFSIATFPRGIYRNGPIATSAWAPMRVRTRAAPGTFGITLTLGDAEPRG